MASENVKLNDSETSHYALNVVCYKALYQMTFGLTRSWASVA